MFKDYATIDYFTCKEIHTKENFKNRNVFYLPSNVSDTWLQKSNLQQEKKILIIFDEKGNIHRLGEIPFHQPTWDIQNEVNNIDEKFTGTEWDEDEYDSKIITDVIYHYEFIAIDDSKKYKLLCKNNKLEFKDDKSYIVFTHEPEIIEYFKTNLIAATDGWEISLNFNNGIILFVKQTYIVDGIIEL